MSQTDGASLAEAGCWGHMKELFLPTARNVLPLLKELKTSKGLEKLGLGPSQLSAQDYEAIASLSHLNYLDLNGNRVTSTDLKVLGGLHSLVDLNLIHTDVDASALDTIRHFEKLKHLYISSRQLSPSDFQKIKGALPKVDVKDTMK
jgi:hypothetical protein